MSATVESEVRTDLTLGVLGPTVVRHDGRPVTLGGPAPRTLLCRLVIANGRFVSIDALVDCLWPDGPPPSARITAQGYLSVLRRALEPGRAARQPGRVLIRDGTGYALRGELITLDVDRFGAAVTQGRELLAGGDARSALARFDEALALWRGPAYADCADHEFVVAESHRLRELRTGAMEHRLEALIEWGADETVVAQLRAFCAAHPLRERGWALLARALYRAGRQGDALAVLRDARNRLRDELGVQPGPELTKLHHDILHQAPALPSAPFVADGGAAGPAGNLPHSISTLVGRVDERQAVADLLSRHRLVTLTGAGGMGKTRLALAVAGARTDADGPWFVELAGLHEPAVLAERLCAALQITGAGGVEALVTALRSRAMLIVLDNCEHLAAAVGALVTTLLSACPNVRVLATSRQSLRVDGEQLFEVPPLSSGPDGEAVTLFTARAAAVLTGWSPGADERRVVARLCAALDGMPLAIEFAAAQCRVLSPRQILEHLDDRFALLVGERTSSRHTTLLGLMDSWYELLTDAERELLQALAVFEGGFGLLAARAVTGRADTLVDLTSLVEKSLVTVVTVADGDDRRYLMLETIRQYALRCTPADRRDTLGGRHTAWIHELAATAGDELRGPDSARWMRLLHVESDNVRAALRRAGAAGDTTAVLRIAGGLYWFWYRQGRVADGLRCLEPALRQADPRVHEPGWIARAAVGLALLRYLGGAHDQVAEALAVAGRHGAATDDLGVRAQALATIAYFEAGGGAAQVAMEHATEALALARAVGHRATAAEALMCIGEAQRRAGLPAQATATLTAALHEADRCGHGWAAVSVLWLMSKVELSLDRTGPASVLVRRMLETAHHHEDTTSWLVGLAMHAYLLMRAGRAEDAAELLGTLRSLGDRVGYQAEAMDAELAGYLAEIPSGSPPDRFAAAQARGRDRSVEQTMAWLRSAAPFGDQRLDDVPSAGDLGDGQRAGPGCGADGCSGSATPVSSAQRASSPSSSAGSRLDADGRQSRSLT
ncbi:BTAD domain-containing putative transcriptional regulator [Micromonospora sp. NPDC092111]|uniref:BTAD domain-containing putative transcriptional regulator n=1 Tax=Micromonospora sp. NPDC092111 TaxID=3364289 RepID=UPI00382D4238